MIPIRWQGPDDFAYVILDTFNANDDNAQKDDDLPLTVCRMAREAKTLVTAGTIFLLEGE